MDKQPPKKRISLSAAIRRDLRWFAPGLLQVSLICCLGLHNSSAETDGAPGSPVKRGEQTFQQRCASCHSQQGGTSMPFGPPSLHGIFRGPSAISTRQAKEIITNGKGSMPAWGNVLTRSEIGYVIDYLKTW
jgi:mono/diheme cytochrome c family protein